MLRWTCAVIAGLVLASGLGLTAAQSFAQDTAKTKEKATKEKRAMTFEIYKDAKEEYRWRLKAGNGNIIASGQGYKAKADCENAVKLIKEGAAKAKTNDMTATK